MVTSNYRNQSRDCCQQSDRVATSSRPEGFELVCNDEPTCVINVKRAADTVASCGSNELAEDGQSVEVSDEVKLAEVWPLKAHLSGYVGLCLFKLAATAGTFAIESANQPIERRRLWKRCNRLECQRVSVRIVSISHTSDRMPQNLDR